MKKIKILRLKEGVRRVDRHGFSLGGRPDEEEVDQAKVQQDVDDQNLRLRYIQKMEELNKLKQM